jgi:hypothetical protein
VGKRRKLPCHSTLTILVRKEGVERERERERVSENNKHTNIAIRCGVVKGSIVGTIGAIWISSFL